MNWWASGINCVWSGSGERSATQRPWCTDSLCTSFHETRV